MTMNKILIALVLAVVMSGNVYAYGGQFESPSDLSYSECIKAIEKGDLIHEASNPESPQFSFLYYLFKNKIYQIRLQNKTNENQFFGILCEVTKEE